MQRLSASLAIVAILGPVFALAQDIPWETAIARFEERDATNPPPKNAVLFLGSSSIRLWKTDEAFPDFTTINRGFGGSQIIDSYNHAHRIAIPYEPHTIVFYAGDNDIASGKPPAQVLDDYKAFTAIIHEALPNTRIIFIGIKPSIARWNLVENVREANRLVLGYSAQHEQLDFLDIDDAMTDETGYPREDLLLPDGLHLNDAGYEIWTALIRQKLNENKKTKDN